MNYVLCNLNLCINLPYLLCSNKPDAISCLLIAKKKNLKISLSLTFILETIWYMGYALLHWYKLVNKYNELNNIVEWLMHTFHMNSL